MDTKDYREKLKALGVDRGKLETGFQEGDVEEPTAPPVVEPQREPPPAPPAAETRPVVNNPVNKCRCGVVISFQSKRCRRCFQQDMKGAPRKRRPSNKPSGVSLPARPSPPPPPVAPAEEESPREVPYRLFLDAGGKRMVVVIAPAVISRRELIRIQAWIGLQLIIEEPAADWDYAI